MITTHVTYFPQVFDAKDIQAARDIILTPQAGMTPNERWETETPYLLELMEPLHLSETSLVLDYGCGIGRIAKALIEEYNCYVVGVDISNSMRELAIRNVNLPSFEPYDPKDLPKDLQVDVVLAIWVLQHCPKVKEDIQRIKDVLKPEGKLFVVNNNDRWIPTKERGWINDGLDIRSLLNSEFVLEKINNLDASIVGEDVTKNVFQGIYRKNGS